MGDPPVDASPIARLGVAPLPSDPLTYVTRWAGNEDTQRENPEDITRDSGTVLRWRTRRQYQK